MLYYKLIYLTILLIILSYTGVTLYTSLCVFGITVTATYICYTLNTQLRLEKYLKHLPIGLVGQTSVQPLDESDFQLTGVKKKHNGLNAFPKPIAKILEKYINSILRDFIQSWYVYIGADEEDFIEEVRIAMEHVVIELSLQLKNVDLHKLVADIIRMFQRHIKTFTECQEIIHAKYPNLQESDFSGLISELYEEAVVKHIATQSKGAELDYLKTLLDILLHKYVPSDTFSCFSGRFLLREILAVQLLEPLIKDVTNPHFVNEIVVDILEPSVPLEKILLQWEDAMKEIEVEEEDQKMVSTPTIENCEFSSPETNYESTHEITHDHHTSTRRQQKKNRRHTSRRIFTSSRRSSSDHSDLNDKSQTKDIIRFDKLDARISNPVYGSTSARDHEKSQLLSPTDKTIDGSDTVIDSTASSPMKQRKTFDPLEITSGEISTLSNIGGKEKHDWAVCPPANAEMFKHRSFSEMPLNQDDFTEQMKAKVSSKDLGSIIRFPISCMDTCGPIEKDVDDVGVDETSDLRMQKNSANSMKKARIMSVDGSVTMQFSSRKESNVKKDPEKELGGNKEDNNKTEEVLRIHSSGTSGAFYDIAPSCPTCIEMTMLASPFQIEKARIVLNEKEKTEKEKNKIIEHECGLHSEHFCNPQAESESLNFDSKAGDDSSVVYYSAPTGNAISDNSMSSGTLLASGESYSESDKDCRHTEKSSSSFDNLSDLSYRSSLGDGYCGDENTIESYGNSSGLGNPQRKRNKRLRHRKPSKAASVATFKTAIEDSVLNESTRLRSQSATSLDEKKNIFDKHFVQLFKNGLLNKKKGKKDNRTTKDKKSKLNKKQSKANKHKDEENQQKSDVNNKMETSSISTSITKFNSLPENPSSVPSHWNSKNPNYMNDLVEEVGFEVEEEDDEGISHHMCPSTGTSVDPLSKEIAVTDKDLLDVKSVKSQEGLSQSMVQDPSKFIPIYEGEVFMPHPSKLPAAWLYPIQMISIPSTEAASEKGWEPGINKYTLYDIHYDIRIWPDLYQKQLKEANVHSKITSDENVLPEPVPLIREIKRRYREFLYLHNRLTHGPLSKHMKGILRPNRRYAMPFGRMDPDVIEGRRKILETYMVSLVSRPELCNSQEFKVFLGSEDYDDVSVVKPKKIGQKKVYQNHTKNILTETKQVHQHNLQVHKENVERTGLNSQYFIHGYDNPRMFGYSLEDDTRKHSKLIISHFVLNYPRFKRTAGRHQFETIQKPQMYNPKKSLNFDKSPMTYDKSITTYGTPIHAAMSDPTFYLGPRTDGDGAETIEDVSKIESKLNSVVVDVMKNDSSINKSIAAKFSEELAARLQEEKKHLASRIAREKDLYESSWPLTDSVLSIASQILKGYGSWLSFEKVQQAILFSLGGIIEWLIRRELDEVIMQERCFKYLTDLYYVVWDKQDNMRPKKPDPTPEEKILKKEEVLQRLMEFIPSFVRISIGTTSYKHCCSKLVQSLQYERINKHLLYAALEIILQELIPDTKTNHSSYITTQNLNKLSSK